MKVALHSFAEGEAAGRAIAALLEIPFGMVRRHSFPDGEILPSVPEPARTVIVYRSLEQPNDKLVELVLASEAWRRRGAKRLVLVAPYLAYMRQDTAFEPGQAISQRAIGALLARYFDRIVTVEPHLHRTKNLKGVFPRVAVDSLSAAGPLAQWIRAQGWDADAVLIGPDWESTRLVEGVAARLGLAWTAMAKARSGDLAVRVSSQAREPIAGRAAILIDDICSSGATLVAAAERAQALGALDVRAIVVHALFSEASERRLHAAGVLQIASTDAAPHPTNRVSLAPLLADALAGELVP